MSTSQYGREIHSSIPVREYIDECHDILDNAVVVSSRIGLLSGVSCIPPTIALQPFQH